MAVVTEKIIDVEIKGVSSVKELKNEIKELRDRLVRLDETSEDYKKTVDELIEDEKKLTSVMRAGKNEVSAATGSYNALSQEMSALKKVWKEVTSEAERSRIGKRIAEINVQLKAMDASIGNFQRNVGDYEGAIKRAFLTPQQEIKKLRVELAQLEQGTEEYNRVFMRMADLTTKVQKQQELLRYSSADLGNILGNLAGVASSVVGGFSAINAAMGLMGDESEDVQQAMLKVQRLMALVQGLSALENLGEKINGLWSGIKRFIDGFRGGTAAVSDFDKATKEAAGTTEAAAGEMTRNASAAESAAGANDDLATSTGNVEKSYKDLMTTLTEIEAARWKEIRDIKKTNLSLEEQAKAIDRVNAKYGMLKNEARTAANDTSDLGKKLGDVTKNDDKLNKETVKTNNIIKLLGQYFRGAEKGVKGAGDAMVVYTAKTTLARVATQMLGVALKAAGIGLLIAGLAKAIDLLVKGATALWNWVRGVNAANAAVEQLKNSQEQLNLVMEDRNEQLDFQTRLMEAQKKPYDEIYNYKKRETTETLNLVKAQLAEAEAQAVQYEGKRRFKKQLEETMDVIKDYKGQIKDLEKTLRGYDQDREIHLAQEANKPKGGGSGGSSYDSQLKAAQNLYKQLQDFYKTDRQKLKETYEENKKTIEKYIKNKADKNKALLLLDKKYYDDLKELTRKNMDAIYGIYMGQENRRLALMNVWDDKYLERAKKVLDEEQRIALRGAAQKVGFQEKSDAEIAKMDAATRKEYLEKRKLFNNERVLIEEEYQKKYDKLVAEQRIREIEEGRRVIEIKKLQAKTEEEVVAAEIELAEYDLANVYQQDGESALQYQVRVNELAKALEELLKKQQQIAANKDWTQLRLDNDAEAARINEGDQSMQYLNARLKAAQNYYDNLKQLEGESMEEYRQRTLEALAELRDTEREILQQRFENYSNLANGIGDIFGSIADMYQTEIQAQKDADGQYNAESKRKFEWVKRLQIAQATIQTISGAIAAFMGCQSLGQPWGAILGAVQAAAVTAAGMAQIAQIKKTKLDGSGGGSSSGTRYAVATPSITDYNPQGTTNLTGNSEMQDLANALSKTPIKAYVVESEISSKQELAKQRSEESTF